MTTTPTWTGTHAEREAEVRRVAHALRDHDFKHYNLIDIAYKAADKIVPPMPPEPKRVDGGVMVHPCTLMSDDFIAALWSLHPDAASYKRVRPFGKFTRDALSQRVSYNDEAMPHGDGILYVEVTP